MHSGFKKFIEAHPNYKNNLPESEILDVIDNVCNSKDAFNV